MECKIYQGEYSLSHWINLILKKEVELPPYQRIFVWDEIKVKHLIDSLKEKLFIPPIIIGSYFENDEYKNYVLDGQQRLSSILLAYLNRYPNKEHFQNKPDAPSVAFINENDDVEQQEECDDILAWTFKEIQNKGERDKDKLQSLMPHPSYKKLDIDINLGDEFLHNTYLGFSFIKPMTKDTKEQSSYYSSVFRNINTSGQVLNTLESRASLYWLNDHFSGFFNPEFIKNINVSSKKANKVDFVKYLSLLFQYRKTEDCNKLAYGYSGRTNGKTIEQYIENYIYHIIGDKPSDKFIAFQEVFTDDTYEPRMKLLADAVKQLEIDNTLKSRESIIDVDLYLFGLVYNVLIIGELIDIDSKKDIESEIDKEIEALKGDALHKKSPAALKYLRIRIKQSIATYNRYVKANP
ncbi:hypothetical protein AGMMS49959_17750 [Planctomycetales bacterium]|nr:hypothetical protein AGMMS49959_17750 [Planctomycetales bacterium]